MPDDLTGRLSGLGVPEGDEPPPPEGDDVAANTMLTGADLPDIAGEGIVPLGHDRGVFYYLSRSAGQVFALQASQHSKNTLMAMASVPHYWQRSQFVGEKGNIRWEDAIDYLMRCCRKVGIFDPDRIRGRGAWIDNGRAVLHTGDSLIVDGQTVGLILSGSRFVYEAAKALVGTGAPPISTADAHRLVGICKALRWQQPVSGVLLAGFIVVAPICGGLVWRPSIWISGGAGSGKTWLKDNILAPAMGGIALQVQSKTSEAGIRQMLGCDARPVLFDEAEREDAASAARMQGVLDLLRQASSEGGGEIVKGSQNQSGAKRYRIRSSFAFTSINVGIEHQADESRITVLALREPNPSQAEAEADRFDALSQTVLETISPDFAAGLISRSVRLLPVIRANAETFARAVSIHLRSRRMGDQLGALLAGAYSLHAEREITDAEALEWVKKQDWSDATETEVDKDELRLLSHLTQHRVRFSPGNGAAFEVTIGRLIAAADSNDPQISSETAAAELLQMGIKYLASGPDPKQPGEPGVHISTNHPTLKHILTGTPWAAGWSRSLGRLPGAVSGGRHNQRFAFGHQSKATWLPIATIEPPERDQGQDGTKNGTK